MAAAVMGKMDCVMRKRCKGSVARGSSSSWSCADRAAARDCIRSRKRAERVRLVKERRLEARTVVGSSSL